MGKKAAGDAGKGEKVYKTQCAVCHAFGSHGAQGPNLQGVVGRPIASTDFGYS